MHEKRNPHLDCIKTTPAWAEIVRAARPSWQILHSCKHETVWVVPPGVSSAEYQLVMEAAKKGARL